ncbi:MAG: DNA adenine methylase [Prolixibacteraceae bacterium]|nr:DNA adenine methylase [Prolixibacteraceae bacterium]
MKPFKSYPGGKNGDGVFQTIINRIPPHDIYIEGFLGNGTIFLKKKRAKYSILIDADFSVIEAWKRIPPDTKVINTDAISWIENFQVPASIFQKLGLQVFIYLDPPYLINSRSSQRNIYKHELTAQNHTRLLNVIRQFPASIMISAYPNKFYDDNLPYWHTHDFSAQTRNGTAIERIYMNYAKPEALHDYRYIGDNYRERERIKGILQRRTQKIKNMPPIERMALIEKFKNDGIL